VKPGKLRCFQFCLPADSARRDPSLQGLFVSRKGAKEGQKVLISNISSIAHYRLCVR